MCRRPAGSIRVVRRVRIEEENLEDWFGLAQGRIWD